MTTTEMVVRPDTQVAPRAKSNIQKMRDYVESPQALREILKASGVSEEAYAKRMARFALTAVSKNPALAECAPASVVSSIIEAAQLKLQVDGFTGQAYIVPYKGKATLQVGYKGLLALARRSGNVKSIRAEPVYVGDEFKVRLGTEGSITHVPDFTKPRAASDVLLFYGVIEHASGGYEFEVMTRDDVNSIQALSKARGDSPWKNHWVEMGRKTVLKRLLKKADLAVDDARAVASDDAVHDDYDPVTGEVPMPREEADNILDAIAAAQADAAEA